MKNFKRFLNVLAVDQTGQTVVEYALMLVLVALAVSAATPGISSAVTGVFSRMAAAL